MIPLRIYVVDDEEIVRVSLADDLRDAGYRVQEFQDARAALNQLSQSSVDVVFSDILMPGMDGLEFLAQLKKEKPDVTVVMMTAYGSVSSAVQAMKSGAFDYITKPFQPEEVLLILDRIKELRSLKRVREREQAERQQQYDFSALVGASEAMNAVCDQIRLVAPSSSTVLITGETGTGKELVANLIHYNSPRKNQPLIKVSCATLARDVFESELFGHEKGAFTGAYKEKHGRFELADGGTIYLDDIDDVPLDLQVKLLRVLEQQEFERVGGSETLKADARVLASTKVDLRKKAVEGLFREDLYYRLNVFPIHIKPLRERRKDIRSLLDFYFDQFAGQRQVSVEPEVYASLDQYDWPGNVRELKNLVERLVLLASDGVVDHSRLPLEVRMEPGTVSSDFPVRPLDAIVAELEVKAIKAALQECNGNRAQAARLLGLPPSTLRTKMEKYGID